MNPRRVLRITPVLVALTLGACSVTASPSLEPTARANVTAAPTFAAVTRVPTPTATARPLLPPTGNILFTAIAPKARMSSIFRMNADGSGLTNLTGTRGGYAPAWSPDGTEIAFTSNAGNGTGIWVMRSDGSRPTQVRYDPSKVAESPAWSPSGRQIAFIESDVCSRCGVGMTWTLNVMNADGSGLHKLAEPGGDDRPAWSSDGQAIFFAGRSDDPPTQANGLQSIRLDGTDLHQVMAESPSSPAWSSDGRLAFLRSTGAADDGTVLFSLVVANADGSSPRLVPLPIVIESPVTWSPDGGWLSIAGATTLATLEAGMWDIWIMRPDGTDIRNLTMSSDRGESAPAWH